MEIDSGCGFGPGLSAEANFRLDVPERLMKLSQPICYHGLESFWGIHESRWIQKRLEPLFGPVSGDDIFSFLRMHNGYNWDIPFIAMYHKDACPSLLKDPEQPEEQKPTVKWYRILWAIQELHHKWLLFQEKKMALMARYKECRMLLKHDDPQKQLFQSLMEPLVSAESENVAAVASAISFCLDTALSTALSRASSCSIRQARELNIAALSLSILLSRDCAS